MTFLQHLERIKEEATARYEIVKLAIARHKK